MTLVPRSEFSNRVLVFGTPPGLRFWGRTIVLAAIASAATLLLFFDIHTPKRELILTGVCISLGFGLAAWMWDETLTLGLSQRKIDRIRGFAGFRFHTSRGPGDVSAIRLHSDRRTDLCGETSEVDSLVLAVQGNQLRLALDWPDVVAEDAALNIADALRRPLERSDTAVKFHRGGVWIGRFAQGAAWAGLLVVAVIMLLPVIRAGKSFRPFGVGRNVLGARIFESGMEQYGRGDYSGAEAKFRQVIERRPRNAEAYNMLAYALAEQQRLREALEAANKAMSLSPQNGMIIDTAAEMHQRLGENELAAGLYEEAAALEGRMDKAETLYKYAQTLVALNRKADAIKRLQECKNYRMIPWSVRAHVLLQQIQGIGPGPKAKGDPQRI